MKHEFQRVCGGGKGVIRFACFLFCVGAFTLKAADRYVATNGADTGTCEDWANAARTIQYAVDLATNVDDIVTVSNGVYEVTSEIVITNRITLKSANGYSNTLVAAAWPTYTTRVFYVANSGVVDGFTISNGHHHVISSGYDGGGGAKISNAIVQNCFFVNNFFSNGGTNSAGAGAFVLARGIVSNCLFYSNMALKAVGWSQNPKGGGLALAGGQALRCIVISNYSATYAGGIAIVTPIGGGANVVSNCCIYYNTAGTYGGGAILSDNGVLTDSVISNNYSGSQAGGVQMSAAVRVQNCSIVNNAAKRNGGGVYLHAYAGNNPFLISNCVISANRVTESGGGGGVTLAGAGAGQCVGCRIFNNTCGIGYNFVGGGVSMTNAAAELRNCLIVNNSNTCSSASSWGGGVVLGGGRIVNCTIAGNYAANEGGGIAALGGINYVANSVIAANQSIPGVYPDIYNTGGDSNNYWYCCANPTAAPLAPGQGNITGSPIFKNAAAGDWRLAANSPGVNVGTNLDWTTNSVDLGGRMRMRYGRVDMGAYETIYEGTIFSFSR